MKTTEIKDAIEVTEAIRKDIKELNYGKIADISLKLLITVAEERLKDSLFIKHIQSHLQKGQVVICKICNKTVDEIIAGGQNGD